MVNLAVVSATSLAAVTLVFAVTFFVGHRIGRYNVVDVTWGLSFVVVAAVGAALGNGDLTRRLLVLALVTVWGARLAWHLTGKLAGHGEDPRYTALLHGDFSIPNVLRKIFVMQAAAAWFISLPLQLSATTGPTPAWLLGVTALGVTFWLVGVIFEAVGDYQLKVFKADPANKGVIMDRGLWSWTRHPNYFGDACVWWGLWLVTLNGWPALATVFSPMLMTYFLVYATGARLTEKRMAGRPGFSEYCTRTAFFVPHPPR
jgi:steroid 5-alpha reductase family enzyme